MDIMLLKFLSESIKRCNTVESKSYYIKKKYFMVEYFKFVLDLFNELGVFFASTWYIMSISLIEGMYIMLSCAIVVFEYTML